LLCKFLNQKFYNANIFYRKEIKDILTVPKLGYVNRKFPNVYYIKDNETKKLKLKTNFNNKSIFIYIPFDTAKKALCPSYDDNWLYVDNSLPGNPIIVYEKK